jgi:hypothetical protein
VAAGGAMKKSRYERLIDFIDQWESDAAGRYEMLLKDGRKITIQDCYLFRDQSGLPDIVAVNHDSPGHDKFELDPLDIVEVFDLEQQYAVIPAENTNPWRDRS